MIIISPWPFSCKMDCGFCTMPLYGWRFLCPHLLPQIHKHTGSRPMQTKREQGRESYNTSAEIHSGMLNNTSAKQKFFWKRRISFFFLSTRDNETIRDRLTRGKSPLARRISYCSFCVLRNCRHSHRQALSLYLWRAATISTARCHQLPHLTHKCATLAQYLATFRPFWRLFSHNRYILTNLATFLDKPG